MVKYYRLITRGKNAGDLVLGGFLPRRLFSRADPDGDRDGMLTLTTTRRGNLSDRFDVTAKYVRIWGSGSLFIPNASLYLEVGGRSQHR